MNTDNTTDPLNKLQHIRALLTRLKDSKAGTPKQLIQAMTQTYEGLGMLEKCSVARLFANTARVATPESDNETLAIFQAAFHDYLKQTGKNTPMPRLIIAESDFANAYAGKFPASKEASVIVSSTLIKLLNPSQLRGILTHEIGHIDRDLSPGVFNQFIATPIKHVVTRNRTRREMETEADSFALRMTGDVESLVSAMEIVNAHNQNIKESMLNIARQSNKNSGIKNDRINNLINWVIDHKVASKIENTTGVELGEPDDGWCSGPKCPPFSERIADLRAKASKSAKSVGS